VLIFGVVFVLYDLAVPLWAELC